MPIVNVNEIEIYYEVHGKGTPLICIGGFTCNRLMWEDYITPLSAHYQLVLFDNRGSGQTSSPDGPYTIKMLAEDTAGLLKALNLSKCYAIGHSMGGAILQYLCFSYPQLIRKGILANTFAKVPNKWKWNMEWTAKLSALGIEKKLFIEGILPWLYSEEFMGDPENRVVPEQSLSSTSIGTSRTVSCPFNMRSSRSFERNSNPAHRRHRR
jgi:3-oxoadipate enol-lactonase